MSFKFLIICGSPSPQLDWDRIELVVLQLSQETLLRVADCIFLVMFPFLFCPLFLLRTDGSRSLVRFNLGCCVLFCFVLATLLHKWWCCV